MPKRKNSRNAQGGGSIRQRKDGKWEGRYTVGRDPGTGRQLQKSVYGTTQKEVRQKLAQVTAALDEGIYTDPSKLTVRAWLDRWLAEYIGGVKPRTAQSYKEHCENHIKPSLGAVRLSDLDTDSIQVFYNQLLRGKGDRAGLSPKTVRNIHGVLHRALNQAIKVGHIKLNPSESCALPRVAKKEISPLEEADISAFLEAIKGHRYEIVYTVTLFTGMRQGEVLGLTWDSVDFDKGAILINKQLQKARNGTAKYYLAPPKNDKSRLISPPISVMNALRKQRQVQNETHLKAGQMWNNEYNLVFTNELGSNLSPQTVYLHFKKIAESISRPDARFHDLRHSYAVVALQAGDDVKTVQENLGHHTAAFTLDVYGHVTEKMKKESAERMEAFIKGVKNQ